jgi:surfeit locus 1 family protein
MTGGIGRFRPALVPTLFTLVAVVVCAGLGVWQLERLQWKRHLIADREAALAAPPAALPRTAAEAAAMQYRRVTAEGEFLHDREILRVAAGPTGGSRYDVLTPLRQADGRVVFVDRGLIPVDLQDPAKRAAGQPAGPTRVTGVLRVPSRQKPSWFLPDNQPERNLWFWIDLPAMAAAARLPEVTAFYIIADATPNPDGWPKGRDVAEPLPNNHLQYAITWFALAIAALVVYLLSQRGGPGQQSGGDEPGAKHDIMRHE